MPSAGQTCSPRPLLPQAEGWALAQNLGARATSVSVSDQHHTVIAPRIIATETN